MPRKTILIFADCHEPHAKGDYKIAGDLAFDFQTELKLQGIHNIDVVLVTAYASVGKYFALYGVQDAEGKVNVMGEKIKVIAFEHLNIKDYCPIAYIDANRCKGSPSGHLTRILNPDTKLMFVFGPHQSDNFATPDKFLPEFNTTWRAFGYSQLLSKDPSHGYFLEGAYLGVLGLGPQRLGIPAIKEVSELQAVLPEEKAQYLPFAEGDYAFAYLSAAFGNLDTLLSEYIELAGVNQMQFVGFYEKEFKNAIRSLPYSADFVLSSGRKGSFEGKTCRAISYKQFDSLPSYIMRRALTGGTALVAVTGASTLIEALLGDKGLGQIVYYQTCELNKGLSDSYQATLKSMMTGDTVTPSDIKAAAVALATALMLPKPMGEALISQVKILLKDQEVTTFLRRVNHRIVRDASRPVARALLPMITGGRGDGYALAQLDKVCETLKKVGEPSKPSFGQALRRACAKGLFFEVKILVTHAGKVDIDINEPDPNKGRTPLMWALIGRREDIAMYLIDHGVSLSIGDSEGLTALHYAMASNSVGVIKALIEMGESTLQVISEAREKIIPMDEDTPTDDNQSATGGLSHEAAPVYSDKPSGRVAEEMNIDDAQMVGEATDKSQLAKSMPNITLEHLFHESTPPKGMNYDRRALDVVSEAVRPLHQSPEQSDCKQVCSR